MVVVHSLMTCKSVAIRGDRYVFLANLVTDKVGSSVGCVI